MFCQKCGKELNEGAKFCDGCGTPIEQQDIVNTVKEQNTALNKSQKKKNGCIGCLAAIIVFFVLFCFIGIFASNSSKTTNKGDDSEGSSQNSQESSTTAYKDVAMGQNGEIDEGLMLKINSVSETNSISAANGYMSYKPDSGKYAIVNITISNKSKESKSLLLNYFKLVGPDDAEYVASIVAMADDKFIDIDTVNPNLDITGNLVFEIPTDLNAQDCILKYSDFKLLNGISYFKLK